MTARARWKWKYRRARIMRREQLKAQKDLFLYGQSAVFVPSDGGDPRHVPIQDLYAPKL